jgi:co-chaperonin GroES (HSP10)
MNPINQNTIIPVGDYLLIEVPNQGSTTSSGLLLAEASDNKMPVVGKVLRVPYGYLKYKISDQVIFRKFSADEIKVTTAESEKSFWLLSGEEVIAIVKEESKIKDESNREQITLKKLSANLKHDADVETKKDGKKSTS